MYRKGVSALIINEKHEFLLVNLISFEERYFAIPGGGVEPGEKLEEAAYREIKEELGIGPGSLELTGMSATPLRFAFKTPKISKEGQEYHGSERHFFGFRFVGTDNDIRLAQDEVRAYKWVSFSDLGAYLLFDNQLSDTTVKIREVFGDF